MSRASHPASGSGGLGDRFERELGGAVDRVRAKEINAKLATDVMGWVRHGPGGNWYRETRPEPTDDRAQTQLMAPGDWNPMGDIRHAMEVADAMGDDNRWDPGWLLTLTNNDVRGWDAKLDRWHDGDDSGDHVEAIAPTPAEAICLATLAALEEA